MANARPQRERRKPKYLDAYECQDSGSYIDNSKQVAGKTKTRAVDRVERRVVLETQVKSLTEKLRRNISKAEKLINSWGSRTLLRAIERRISETNEELEAVVEELKISSSADYLITVQGWLDKVQELTEDTFDNITQHLDTRAQEPPSEGVGSIHSDQLSKLDIMEWLTKNRKVPAQEAVAEQDEAEVSEGDATEGNDAAEQNQAEDEEMPNTEPLPEDNPNVAEQGNTATENVADKDPSQTAEYETEQKRRYGNNSNQIQQHHKTESESEQDRKPKNRQPYVPTRSFPHLKQPMFPDHTSKSLPEFPDVNKPPSMYDSSTHLENTLNYGSHRHDRREEEDQAELRHFFQGIAKPSLKKFSGEKDDYFDWREQFDLFVDQAKVPVRHKMVMLKSILVGEPQRLLEKYSYTHTQYQAALEKLESRYGGKRRLIQRHLQRLMSQPTVHENDLKGLEKFANNLEDAVIGLKEQGGETALEGDTTLLSIVIQKTPDNVYLKYQDSHPEHENLYTFSNWLSTYVSRRIELKELKEPVKKDDKQDKRKGYNQKSSRSSTFMGTTKAKLPSESSQKTGTESYTYREKCPLCQKGHQITYCPKWRKSNVKERWELAKLHKRCYRCLVGSHLGKNCVIDVQCPVEGCTRNHHKDLHYTPKETTTEQTANNAFGIAENGRVQVSKVALRLIPVKILGPSNKVVTVNTLLDDGSDSTYIREDLAELLGLTTESAPLTVSTLLDNKKIDSGLVSFEIQSLDGDLRRKIGARTLSEMCGNMYIPNWCRKKSEWKHLADITFPKNPGRKTVDLLIGSDHPELTIALEERVGNFGEPIARKTPLGWTCTGVLDKDIQESSVNHVILCHGHLSEGNTTEEDFKRLWNMDILDPEPEDILTPDEERALRIAMTSRKKIRNRIQIAIPWKEGCPDLPDNKVTAERRLRSLEAQLKKKPPVAERYKESFNATIEKGYIRKLTNEESGDTPGWYLPRFAVVKEDKETSKVRIVYDAAATHEGVSLNEQMLPGPNLQKDIVEILIRFREKPIALAGDIKEMFNQIILDPNDCRYHRLLWRNLNPSQPIETYEAVRVVFGDRASPFLAQFVLQQQANEFLSEYPEAATVLLTATYMDDIAVSLETVETAKRIRKELEIIAKPSGFDIRKWCSNAPEVLEGIPMEDRAAGVKINDMNDNTTTSVKALGAWWDAKEDRLTYTVKIITEEVNTKRKLLSRIATTFDPLQYLSPIIIQGKIALQAAWLAGVEWDERLPPEIQESVDKWLTQLNRIPEVKIPRCYRQKPIEEVTDVSLHTFCDASKDAYTAVSYIRFLYKDDNVECSFVASKTRVTPLRAISIPRLELMAAVLGVRLARIITKVLAMSSEQLHFWSDSTDVIFWVKNQSRKFKPFVANRVSEIQESTSPTQWKHIPGKLNPADDATRGLKVDQIGKDSRWNRGPDFLSLQSEFWPKISLPIEQSVESICESPKTQTTSTTLMARSTDQTEDPAVIDFDRFSSWLKLRRVVAWVLRFGRQSKKRETDATLRVNEIEQAEIVILKQIQQESFPETIQSLRLQKTAKGNLKDLSPFMDQEGLLRVGGRLQHSDLPYDSKHPIILPKSHQVTQLIIRYYHIRGYHSRGVNGTLADTRERYWIINGRETIKKQVRNCVDCQKMRKKPAQQAMAALPAMRSKNPLRAFVKCGIDYGGPFLVKITRNTKAKRYICLFTCTASRAVHLEIAYSLDTAGFLKALSRMIARRGKPEEIVSDNGSNFIGAEKELRMLLKDLDKTKIREQTVDKGITWHFNPPLGAHHGGVFESMIKLTKRALKAILGEASVNDEELLTAVTEVEGLLNSRPLLYTSDDAHDKEVLTPNHFIIGQAGGQLAPQVDDEITFNPRHRWRYVQDLTRQIWQRWQREYLTSLQRRQKWLDPEKNLAVGDMVLLVEQNSPRGRWPLGRVLEVYPGADHLVRTVRVESSGKSFVRPVTKLCRLEMETQ